MAVLRQLNVLGQQRLDVPHIRMIESAVCGDFDTLAGKIMAGGQPLIITGWTIPMTTAVGNAATSLQVVVAGSRLIHFEASESGSIYGAAADQANETLSATNTNVVGSFTANTTNYIGINLVRGADDTTTDNVQFANAAGTGESSRNVPLARTLQYRIVISQNTFATSTTVAPIAKVVTDSSNNVVSVTDARNLFFRLGSGGDSPDIANTWTWASRAENPVTSTSTTSPFTGGDKSIGSLKDWSDAVMTRIWELGGGEYWYSSTADRNLKLIRDPNDLVSGATENFYWDGTNLLWKGLSIAFENSTEYYNDVPDQTSNSAGLTNLSDGQCIYVDIDRASNSLATNPTKVAIDSLGSPTVPGTRVILAWRIGSEVYTRDAYQAVGVPIGQATSTSYGVVKLSTDQPNSRVAPIDNLDIVIGTGLSRASADGPDLVSGALLIGTASVDASIQIGRASQTTTMPGALRFSTAGSIASDGSNIDTNDTAKGLVLGNQAQLTGINIGSNTSRTSLVRIANCGANISDVIIGTVSKTTDSIMKLYAGGSTSGGSETTGAIYLDALRIYFPGSVIHSGNAAVLSIGVADGTGQARTGDITIGRHTGSPSQTNSLLGTTVNVGTGGGTTLTLGRTGNTNTYLLGGALATTSNTTTDMDSGTTFALGATTATTVTLGRTGNTSTALNGGAVTINGGTSTAIAGSSGTLTLARTGVTTTVLDSINIPAAADYKYATARTFNRIILPASMLLVDGSRTSTYFFNDATDLTVAGQFELPIGAIITGVQVFFNNSGAGSYNVTMTMYQNAFANASSAFTTTTFVSNTQSVANTPANNWVTYALTGTPTLSADAGIFFDLDASSLTANDLRIYGVRITYTITNFVPAA
jgi:hypothetical protein